jgi:hypothetical protein
LLLLLLLCYRDSSAASTCNYSLRDLCTTIVTSPVDTYDCARQQ